MVTGRLGLEAGPAAALAFHFLVAVLDQAFAFAILALFFLLGVLLHPALPLI
jgi:F0F1-type ATP synthase membrane subunit a